MFSWPRFWTAVFPLLGGDWPWESVHGILTGCTLHRGVQVRRFGWSTSSRYAGSLSLEGGLDFLGRGASNPPSEIRSAWRDPHSAPPRRLLLASHMGWIIFGEGNHNNTKLMSKYAPDLAKHRFYIELNNWHWVPMVVLGVILLAIGGLRCRLCSGAFASGWFLARTRLGWSISLPTCGARSSRFSTPRRLA